MWFLTWCLARHSGAVSYDDDDDDDAVADSSVDDMITVMTVMMARMMMLLMTNLAHTDWAFCCGCVDAVPVFCMGTSFTPLNNDRW